MEDEVLESAINQIVDEHLETVHSEAPEEEIRYSSSGAITNAVHWLQLGEWEIIHEEQHASGAYLVTICAVNTENPVPTLPTVTLVVTFDGYNLLHDAQNTEDAPLEIDEQGEALLEAALAAEEVVIPPNSGSLLVDEATSRFSGAIWYSAIQSKIITLAGVGGIGSYVGFLLARLKPVIS